MAGYTAGYSAGRAADPSAGAAFGSVPPTTPTIPTPAPAAAIVWCPSPHLCLSDCGPQRHEVTGRCGSTSMKCCAQNQTSRGSAASCGPTDPCCAPRSCSDTDGVCSTGVANGTCPDSRQRCCNAQQACSNIRVRECLPDSNCPNERTEAGYCPPNTNNDVCCRRACGGSGYQCKQQAFCDSDKRATNYYCAGGWVCCAP